MLNCDFNKVIITGVPVKISAINKTKAGGSVFNMTIRSEGVKKSTYVDVTVWGELAEKVHHDAVLRSRILVEGLLQEHVSEEGQHELAIHANRIYSLEEGCCID